MGIVGTRRPWHFTSQGPEKSLNAPCPICYAGSMIILQYFFLLLLALYAWAVLNPMAARTFVAGLVRRRRRYLVQHYGRRSANRLFREFRHRALAEGADAGLIEDVIDGYRPEGIESLGTRVSNVRLGKPRPLERYF